jgi:peptidoglycan hydrolase CwlO-like protein
MSEHRHPKYSTIFLWALIVFCTYILSYREEKLANDINDVKRQQIDMRIEIESNPLQYQIRDLQRQINSQDKEITALKQDVEALKRNE